MLSLILFQNVIKIAIMLEINDICKSYMSTPDLLLETDPPKLLALLLPDLMLPEYDE